MENFNYQPVPFHHPYCLNPSCVRSMSCLRHLVVRYVPAKVTHIMAMNPASYPAGADRCVYFRSTEKQRYTRDISSLFDNIPHKKTVHPKRKMYDLYPRTTYCRILYQEHALSSGEQEEIAALFLQTDIDEIPVFDKYADEYNWDEQHTPRGSAAPQPAEWMNG